MKRLGYEDSCRLLQSRGVIEDGIPPLLDRPPRHDDDRPGLSFFRTLLADAALDNLTLPRSFFGRSEICKTSFRGTDLSESTANWNDFVDVDFGRADLSRVDFRGCVLANVRFTNACLAGADLRHCSFADCSFAGADLSGVKLTAGAGKSLALSVEQHRTIDWQTDDGEEPEGG